MAYIIALLVAFLVWKFVFQGGSGVLPEEKQQYVKAYKRTVKAHYRKAPKRKKSKR
jgi:hypothetical protein